MCFKKKTKKIKEAKQLKQNIKNLDTNYIKQEILKWAVKQNVEIWRVAVFWGDFRDGEKGTIIIMVYFKTNFELEKYKENGFISELKLETIRLLKEAIVIQDDKIEFEIDALSNRKILFWPERGIRVK